VAVVAGGLVVIVVSIACLGGRTTADDDDLDGATEPAPTSSLGRVVPMVWGPRRIDGARRRRQVCQRTTRGWAVIARQTESVG
jgi:hypothetical protein